MLYGKKFIKSNFYIEVFTLIFKKHRQKRSVFCSNCQNGGEGCWISDKEICVRYLPLKNTNLTKIDGVIETPPNIDNDAACQMFVNWIDSLGWKFTGQTYTYEFDQN